MTAVGGNDPQAKHSGTWKQWNEFYANYGGTWKTATNVYVKKSGTWVEVWNHVPIITLNASSDVTPSPAVTINSATNYGYSTANLRASSITNATKIIFEWKKSTDANYVSSVQGTINTSSGAGSGTASGLQSGGAEPAIQYVYRATVYNEIRQVQVSATVNPNGFSTATSLEWNLNNNFNDRVNTQVISLGTTTTTTTYTKTIVLPELSKDSAQSTVYYRFISTNDSVNETTSSVIAGSSIVPTYKQTTTASTSSFSTYVSRFTEYTTVTENDVWTYPSIPTNGSAITSVTAQCIGGGGGGGRGINSTAAGGGGAGTSVSGTIDPNGGNLTVVVGRGGIGAGKVSPYSNNGQGSGVYRGSVVAPIQSVTASGGTVGDSGGAGNGGSSTYSGGSGYISDPFAFTGGGGGGILGQGGNGTATTAGAGGGGVLGVCGGGGGAGHYYIYTGGPYGLIITPYGVTGAGNSGGGNGAVGTDGGDATSYGSGGGGASNGLGGNGYKGYVKISWVGP